jgi:hypothetical protein
MESPARSAAGCEWRRRSVSVAGWTEAGIAVMSIAYLHLVWRVSRLKRAVPAVARRS